jgi:hypothetical protein
VFVVPCLISQDTHKQTNRVIVIFTILRALRFSFAWRVSPTSPFAHTDNIISREEIVSGAMVEIQSRIRQVPLLLGDSPFSLLQVLRWSS